MQNGKIATYLGFCIRSGKICFGLDAVEEKRKGIFLLIFDEGLSEKSMKNALALREKFRCPSIVTGAGELGELMKRPAVKAVGIREQNLAAAILKEAERLGEWKIYSGGSN